MGSWFSSTNSSTNNSINKNTNNNSPKPASYSFLSKPPNFAILFGSNAAEKLMEKYYVYNKNLNGNNFAQVFIHKILNDSNLQLQEKISQLNYFKDVISTLKFKQMTKNKLNGVKKAHEIIFDNYDKYNKQIDNAILKLQNQNKKPNVTQNSSASEATGQNANQISKKNTRANFNQNSSVSTATGQNANTQNISSNQTAGKYKISKYKKSLS
jgi:hypothetical protein